LFAKPSKPTKKFEQYFINQNPRLNVQHRTSEIEISCKRKIVENLYNAEILRMKTALKDYFLFVLRTIHSRKQEIDTKRAYLMLSVPPNQLPLVLSQRYASESNRSYSVVPNNEDPLPFGNKIFRLAEELINPEIRPYMSYSSDTLISELQEHYTSGFR
jgi:hypothetical protein